MKHKILLSLIFLIAVVLRLVFSVPPSLNWDETSLGYNAYSILKTGKDEWGRAFPLSFEAFGDYKLPGYVYTDVPFIALFGLNEQGVRLPSQIGGVISVLLLFLIVRELTKKDNLALISAFLLAVSPWHVFLSRAALEANLSLTFFLAGLYFFLKGLKKSTMLIPASIFLALTIFTYNSARIFTPLFVISLLVIYRQQIRIKRAELILPTLIFGASLLLVGFLAIFQDSSSRYFWVTILDQGAINFLNDSRTNSQLPGLVSKLIYNRYVYFLQSFVGNYLSHFSLEFLFLKGGSNHQFSVPNTGLLYIIELPFLLLGVIEAFKKKAVGWVILSWVLLAPIPAAITRDSPHVLRGIFMLGGLQVLSGMGFLKAIELVSLKKWIWKNTFFIGVMAFLVFNIGAYFYHYFLLYPKQEAISWQYGYKQLYNYLERDLLTDPQNTNKPLYITKRYGEPHIFYLFFTGYDPVKYQNNPTLVRYARTNWRWVDRIDNLHFINDWDINQTMSSIHNAILVTSPGGAPPGSTLLHSIYFPDGTKVFDIVAL